MTHRRDLSIAERYADCDKRLIRMLRRVELKSTSWSRPHRLQIFRDDSAIHESNGGRLIIRHLPEFKVRNARIGGELLGELIRAGKSILKALEVFPPELRDQIERRGFADYNLFLKKCSDHFYKGGIFCACARKSLNIFPPRTNVCGARHIFHYHGILQGLLPTLGINPNADLYTNGLYQKYLKIFRDGTATIFEPAKQECMLIWDIYPYVQSLLLANDSIAVKYPELLNAINYDAFALGGRRTLQPKMVRVREKIARQKSKMKKAVA